MNRIINLKTQILSQVERPFHHYLSLLVEDDYSTGWLSSLSLHARMHKAIRANPFLTYPKRSIDMGGEEGGVCMDPAMVREELAQWGLWWSPFNLSGGVNMPPPPSVKLNKKHLYICILR